MTPPRSIFKTSPLSIRQNSRACARGLARTTGLLVLAAGLLLVGARVEAQQKYSKSFPAVQNVKLLLTNWSGAITVEVWQKNEIRISATLEAPAAKFTPIISGDNIEINVVRDNSGRADLGSVNFRIQVPVNSNIDVETRMGDIVVNGVHGDLVRAHVSSDGDVSLTDISARKVMAENLSGNILFDGELQPGGTYSLKSVQGNISIRIPSNSAFHLVATAPASRNISMGMFPTTNLLFVNNNRRVIGDVGSASASLTVSNQRGSISFFAR